MSALRRTAARTMSDDDAIVRATFESALDGVVVLDRDDRQVAFNSRFVELWQFPPDLLARRDTREMRHFVARQLKDPQRFLANVPHVGSVERPTVVDEIERLDGRILERHVSPLGEAGFPGAVVVRWRDVTEIRRAQREQLRTAAQMELAMAAAGLVFWEVDLVADRVSMANPDWIEHTLGWTAGELSPERASWDALVHPDDAATRLAAWAAHVEGRTPVYESEFRARHKDGRWLWLLSRGRAIERDRDGRATRVVGMRIDITRRKLAEQLLEQQAFTDGLTGMLTRRRFLELAESEVDRARRHGQPVALLMIDLDRFKSVNDRYGHAGGDAVLRAFAALAQSILRGSDLLGRVGGEEFAVLLPQTDADGAAALAQRLQQLIREQPVTHGEVAIAYTASFGVAAAHPVAGATQPTVEALMLAADDALYRAKGGGGDQVQRAGD